jgi:hypothetical protein
MLDTHYLVSLFSLEIYSLKEVNYMEATQVNTDWVYNPAWTFINQRDEPIPDAAWNYIEDNLEEPE